MEEDEHEDDEDENEDGDGELMFLCCCRCCCCHGRGHDRCCRPCFSTFRLCFSEVSPHANRTFRYMEQKLRVLNMFSSLLLVLTGALHLVSL